MATIFDDIYEEPNAVWTRKTPHAELKRLFDTYDIPRGNGIDIGCGEGYNTAYLARLGFAMTGIDISNQALQHAATNTDELDITFCQRDARNIDELSASFDFALEWGLLHHLPRDDWISYLVSLTQVLNNQAWYVSMTFNIQSPEFEGRGVRERTSPRGTTLHYTSLQECKELFSHYFTVQKATTIPIPAEDGPGHIGNFFVLRT